MTNLVLQRKRGERIHIGDNIVVTVQRIKGNSVRLAVEAARTTKILRGELTQPKPNGGEAAA